ncbi:MAG TPA: hypothetical protein VLE43_09680 [Candidatus Saccharimonadia bacterium]|nr:hypothetical protein [Candidatus Saccharimonadia bacterium]
MCLPTSLLRLCSALVLSSALASCSIGYNRDWQKAAATDATLHPKNLEGAWTGTWKSNHDGHQGKLRAIVTSLPSQPGQPERYSFRYHATWANILSGTITAEHQATHAGKKKGGIVTLSGEKDLGRLGGVYGFTGAASPTEFKADYKSKLDKGVFEMKRPVK